MKKATLLVGFLGAMLLGTLAADDKSQYHQKKAEAFYKSLNLSEEQIASIKKIKKDHRETIKSERKAMRSDAKDKKDKKNLRAKHKESMEKHRSNMIAEIAKVLDDSQREQFMEHVKKEDEKRAKKQEIRERHFEGMKPIKEKLRETDDKDEKKRLRAELEKKWDAMNKEMAELIDDPKEREAFLKAKKDRKERRKSQKKMRREKK